MEMPSTPRLYMLCGPSLGGQSTICKRLVDVLDAAGILTDEINAERNLPFGGEGLPESIWAETLAKAFGSLRMADTRRSRRRNRFICRTRCLD